MTFEEEFAAAPLKHIFVSVRGPRKGTNPYDPGRAIEGAFKVVGGQVIMCDANGHEVIDGNGRRYRHTLGKDDDLNEREAAGLMVKRIKSELKIGGERVSGFTGPLYYPKLGWC